VLALKRAIYILYTLITLKKREVSPNVLGSMFLPSVGGSNWNEWNAGFIRPPHPIGWLL